MWLTGQSIIACLLLVGMELGAGHIGELGGHTPAFMELESGEETCTKQTNEAIHM